jgi:hypothetical protein
MSCQLYPRNESRELDLELFRAPTAAYRGTPFWSWNNKLDVDQLLRQIECFKQMGFGGFHIHARTGLATEYLGDEFMSAVRACADKAATESMLCWLYDEDRWPSGFAGGIVTGEAKDRAKHLLWTQSEQRDLALLSRFEVSLVDGRLARYRRLAESEAPSREGSIWYAYLRTAQPDSWYNNQTYVDTFSRTAIERFIEVTHERYRKTVGQYFGGVVPAIFTDEPQFLKKTTLSRAAECRDLVMPFTNDFCETFRVAYGQDLLDHLPELFWNLPADRPSLVRFRYHDHTAERFAQAFGDTIAQWCDEHGIALTGHMLSEFTLHGQTRAVGECMRGLRSFQLPGIDILCDGIELTTAKQAASIAHQFGRAGVMSELYGVTNWDFDFAGHKRQGDWQAALGVTVRVPHLAWVSMAGEAKRDYPAAIDYHSPWWREYKLVEDHFARLNTVLTRGKPLVRVAVIHPIESFWLAWGPVEHNGLEWEEREKAFSDITNWLLYGLIDFEYVSESLLPEQCRVGFSPPRDNGRLKPTLQVGEMAYAVIVIPHMRTIRSTTLQRLEGFADAGGTVIFAGEMPSLVDAAPSDAPAKLAARCKCIELTRRQLLNALAPFRDIDVRRPDGSRADTLLYQLCVDGDDRYLFLCNTHRDHSLDRVEIKIRGRWEVTQLDSMTGRSVALAPRYDDDHTIVSWSVPAHGHVLLRCRVGFTPPSDPDGGLKPTLRVLTESARLDDPVPITLSEPNALLLDQAEWRLDNGPWRPREEILRLDNLVREKLGLARRGGRIAQPWTDREPAPVLGRLQLKFTIRSDVSVTAPRLAFENAEQTQIDLDGVRVASEVDGWWVDEAIKTVALPDLDADEHSLLLTIPFTRKTDVEWCYLLGDFGVSVAGRHTKLVAPIRSLAWGDWTHQGLPFYAGNMTYHCTIPESWNGRLAHARTMLEIAKFRSPLLSIDLDGRCAGKIAFAPYQLELGKLSQNEHRLDITAYGNRHNAFGPVHNTNENLKWVGPAAWRSEGAGWAYEYQLKPIGILAAPIVKIAE